MVQTSITLRSSQMESLSKVTQHKQSVFLIEVRTTDLRSGIGKSKWTFLWQNLKSYIHFSPPPKREANICLSSKSCSGSMCSKKPPLLYSQSASPSSASAPHGSHQQAPSRKASAVLHCNERTATSDENRLESQELFSTLS